MTLEAWSVLARLHDLKLITRPTCTIAIYTEDYWVGHWTNPECYVLYADKHWTKTLAYSGSETGVDRVASPSEVWWTE